MKTKLLCGIIMVILFVQYPFAQNTLDTNNAHVFSNNTEEMQSITLQLKTRKGFIRIIDLAFSDFTTDEFDQNYDVIMNDSSPEDIYTYLENHKMSTQAYPSVNYDMAIPIVINLTGYYKYGITAIDFDGFDKDTGVYLIDKYDNIFYDLRKGGEYGFESERGEFTDRFEIVFKTNKDVDNNRVNIFYNTKIDNLIVKGLDSNQANMVIYDINGYVKSQFSNVDKRTLENGLNLSNLRTGIYVVNLTQANGLVTSKKLIVR